MEYYYIPYGLLQQEYVRFIAARVHFPAKQVYMNTASDQRQQQGNGGGAHVKKRSLPKQGGGA